MAKDHKRGPARWKLFFAVLILFCAAAACIFTFHGKLLNGKAAEKPLSSSSAASVPVKKEASSQQPAKDETKHLVSVPFISQEEKLPSGCELISSMMLLKYYGQTTTADEIMRRTPKSTLLAADGNVYGMSPNQAFIGNPYSPDGLGCYSPVITAVVDSYFWDAGKMEAVNLTGTSLDKLARDYIAKNSPVIVWATVNMEKPGQGQSWILADTNKSFQWISGEHCLVMVGYDQENYYFNDPADPTGVKSYKKSLAEERYQDLGKQAVAVRPVSSVTA
ncbi:Peptidase_C39 like family protein [Caprobacter fermentans]|uniref:Peptidase_C39 like family protein n=1 Tax=Caproicibacter fermentans TaxID=2576756 RepID=A0A6N8I183_9FIRM|nr:C39 family peptidase [Caproicibacter fermentans]MVB11792.1 Peptidase_C39 like family protein [Caproicibacter fermentans]